MNLLVVGVSHRTAGVPLLERLAVAGDQLAPLVAELLAQTYVGEAMVLSTCNRVEVYAAVSAFHGGLADIGAVLARHADCPVSELAAHLYVHYDAEAVRHSFRVAGGLDSMVVGEAQILGQLRDAYRLAADGGAAGRLLHELMQQALRVGKRVHAETGIDRAGQSVVSAALAHGLAKLDPAQPASAQAGASITAPAPVSPGLRSEATREGGALGASGLASAQAGASITAAGRSALVIGAGAMGALALATLRRIGAGPLWVANRSRGRAERLASNYAAEVAVLTDVVTSLSNVDIVVCATAAPDPVLAAGTVGAALRMREPARGPLLILDLAIPRDVEPVVAELPGVVLVDIERLGSALSGVAGSEVRTAEELVAAEVDGFLTWLRGSDVAPTVAALRSRADEVVDAELRRLAQRRPDLSDEQRSEVAHALHRVVQRLLHQPTVRIRQLASEPGGTAYAAVLRELFDLDVPGEIDVPGAVEAAQVSANSEGIR